MRVLKIVGLVAAVLFVVYFTLPTTSILIPIIGHKPTTRDWFYAFVAHDFDAPQLCDKISPRTYVYSKNVHSRYDYLQSACYEQLAIITDNVNLCAHVRSITIGGNRSACSKQDCEANVTNDNWGTDCQYRDASSFDGGVIPFILSGLGYTATKINTLSGVATHNSQDGSVRWGYTMPAGSMSAVEKQTFINTVETADLDSIIKALPNGPPTFELLSPVGGQKIPWNSTIEIKWHFSPGISAWTGQKVGIIIKLEQEIPKDFDSNVQNATIDSDTGMRVVGDITSEGIVIDPNIHITDTTIPLSQTYELNLSTFLSGYGFYESDLSTSNNFHIVFDASHLGWGTFTSDAFTILAP